jgi:hypothetical protein
MVDVPVLHGRLQELEDLRDRIAAALAELDAVVDVAATLLRGALQEVERLLLDEAGSR